MLVVTVEIWPQGQEDKKQFKGRAFISNDGTGDVQIGNYDTELTTWHQPPRTWKKGKVAGFNRKTHGPWDLLYLALRSIVGRRNA